MMRIDGLRLPEDVSIAAEKQNFDTSKRSVSGRLITKLAPAEKWRLVISFENLTLNLSLQAAFYEKCMQMRNVAAAVEFTNPYTGEMETAIMRCVARTRPEPAHIVKGRVSMYKKIGAVFEEV